MHEIPGGELSSAKTLDRDSRVEIEEIRVPFGVKLFVVVQYIYIRGVIAKVRRIH